MVNINVQGDIPIEGAGFVARRNGDFKPGEFKRLTNVEMWNQALVNRRSVKSVAGDSVDTAASSMDNTFGFMGYLGNYSIIASRTVQQAVAPGEQQTMWAPDTNLPTPVESGSFHKLVGYFRYNKRNNWITMEFRSGVHIKLYLYHGPASLDNDVPETYNNAYFATLTKSTIYTITPTDPSFNDFRFQNFFIQGNRLWVTTSLGMYFSAATDPSDFLVPNGGFFKFPDAVVNYGVSLRDSIYVLCDNSIHTITYSTDPNLDSFVTQISDTVGGEDGCVFRDAVYVINQVGIYRIMNNSVDKLIENEFDVGLDYYRNSLSAFEDYLVINKYQDVNYEKFTSDNVQTRVNLVPNPSFESNMTGWSNSNSFMTRARADLNPPVGGFSPFAGSDFVGKATKVNDMTVVVDTNHYKNPSFEVDTSFHTAGSFVDLFQVAVPAGAVSPAPQGTKVLQVLNRVNRNADNPQTWVIGRNIVTSDYYPVNFNEYWDLNFSYHVGENITSNQGKLFFKIAVYDASFNEILFAGSSGIIREALDSTHSVWHDWNTFSHIYHPDIDLTNAKYVKFVWEMDTKRVKDETFNFYLDKMSLYKITSDEYTSNTPRAYFDGNTADTSAIDYTWSGTAGKSATNKLGYEGTGSDLTKIFDYTNNDILVTPAVGYTVGVAFATSDDVHGFEVLVRQYNAADVLLSTSTVSLGSTTDKTSWFYLSGKFTATTNAHHIELSFRTTETIMFNHVIYFDACIVEKTSTYQGYFDGSFPDSSTADYSWVGTPNASTSTLVVSNLARKLFKEGRQFVPFRAGNALGYNIYFINMDNGSLHVMDFKDARGLNEDSQGRVVELFVNPNKDSSGNYNMYMYTARKVSETDSGYTFRNNMYYISSFRELDFVDFAVNQDNLVQRYPVKVEVEFDSYVPDGSEYLTKKFRSLLLMAKLPTTDFKVKFGYNNLDYTNIVDLSSVVTANRPHSPYRIGINQKCSALSIFLFNDNSSVTLAEDASYESLEISDLQTLWTYTGRAIERSRL